MGRWAQRQKRGGGGLPSVPVLDPAPTVDQWDLTNIGGGVWEANTNGVGPTPTDGYKLFWTENGGATQDGGALPLLTPNSQGPSALGTVIVAWIEWWDLGTDTQQSADSPTQTITLV